MNKVLSVVLGLVVVVILIAALTSQLKKSSSGTVLFGQAKKVTPVPTARVSGGPSVTPRKGFFSFLGGAKPSATPTPSTRSALTVTTAPTPASQQQVQGVQNIPKTGPGFLLPLVLSSLAAGVYLKRKTS